MRVIALIKRICQQMFRDKRTLALLFVAPLLILTLMYFLFNGNTVDPKLGVTSVDSDLAAAFKKADIQVKEYKSVTNHTILDDDLDGLLQQENGNIKLSLRDPFALQRKLRTEKSASFPDSRHRAGQIRHDPGWGKIPASNFPWGFRSVTTAST